MKLCRLKQKRQLTSDVFDFTIEAETLAKEAQPGQFAHLRVPGKTLRRPISICFADQEEGTLRLVFQVRGEGTELLSQTSEGEELDVLAPLGHGFARGAARKILVVGGGVGVPPLLYAAAGYGENARAILGFRNREAVILREDFEALGCPVTITTDDGSMGVHGLVTGPLAEELRQDKPDLILACGPTPMLKGVAALAAAAEVACQVSLEERMGCGVGACLVCACKTSRSDAIGGYSHVCKDGPVFDAREVEW